MRRTGRVDGSASRITARFVAKHTAGGRAHPPSWMAGGPRAWQAPRPRRSLRAPARRAPHGLGRHAGLRRLVDYGEIVPSSAAWRSELAALTASRGSV